MIESLDDPVVQTVPRLRGSAYDGVSIRDVLQMSTGVGWVETYLDAESDRRKLMALRSRSVPASCSITSRACRASPSPEHASTTTPPRPSCPAPSLAGAIRRPISDYLSEKIWRPCGMGVRGLLAARIGRRPEFAGSGLSATLRDYGRFGLFALAVPGSPLAPPGGRPGYEPLGYGYQWWTFPQLAPRRVVGALGIFGQQIYVDVDAAVVIVVHGAWPQPVHDPSRLESYTFFEAVTEALRTRCDSPAS